MMYKTLFLTASAALALAGEEVGGGSTDAEEKKTGGDEFNDFAGPTQLGALSREGLERFVENELYKVIGVPIELEDDIDLTVEAPAGLTSLGRTPTQFELDVVQGKGGSSGSYHGYSYGYGNSYGGYGYPHDTHKNVNFHKVGGCAQCKVADGYLHNVKYIRGLTGLAVALTPKPLGPDWCCYTCKNIKKCENFMYLDIEVGGHSYGYGYGPGYGGSNYNYHSSTVASNGGIDPFFVNICLAYPELYNFQVLTNRKSRKLGVKSGFLKREKKCGSGSKGSYSEYGKDSYSDYGKDSYSDYGKDSYGDYGKDSYGNYGKDSYGDYGKDSYGHKDSYGDYGKDSYSGYGKDSYGHKDY